MKDPFTFDLSGSIFDKKYSIPENSENETEKTEETNDSTDIDEDNIVKVNLSNESNSTWYTSPTSMKWVRTTPTVVIYRSNYHVTLQ